MNKIKKILFELLSVFRTGLGRRIALPFLLVLAMMSIPLVFIYHLENVTDESNAVVQNKDVIHEQLYEIQGGMRQQQVAIYEMVYEKKPAAVNDFRSGAIRVQEANEAATQTIDNTEEASLLNDCRNLHQQIQGIVESELIPATTSRNTNILAAAAVEEKVQPLFNRAADLRAQLNDLYMADKQDAIFRQVESREFASEMMWVSIFLFMGLGLVVATYSTRKLIWPIRQISEASLQMARGDLSQRVEVKGRDELAVLGGVFNDMADSLERQTSQLKNEKARIRSIHQSIGDGIIVVDRGGVMVSVNPAAERALGKTAKELERTSNSGIPDLQRVINSHVLEADMVKCWEAKSCAKADCPSHGSPDHRCWLQCGTFCYNQIQGTFKQKRDACERCDVFIKNAVIQFELDIDGRVYSGQAVPILDDFGQQEGRTIVLHDVSELRRSKEDAEHSAARLSVLNSVSRAAAGSLELDSIFEASLASVIGGTMADSGLIHTKGEGGAELILAASQGIDETFRMILGKIPECASEGGCPGHVAESGKPVLENDLEQLGADARAAVDAGFHSYVGAPLIVKKEIVGVISLMATEPNAFTNDDKNLLSMIGTKVGMAVENASLFLKTIEHANQEKAMSRIAAVLASSFDLESNFEKFAEEMGILVHLDRMTVIERVRGKNRVLTPSFSKPLINTDNADLDRQNTAANWVVQNKTSYVSGDIEGDIRFDEQPKLVDQGMKSQINIPLIARGEALGSLNIASIKKHVYDEETADMLRPVADQLALALANQQLFEDISQAKTEWETTFDAASEGIVMVSKDYRITRINNTAATMLGGRV
ncbi:MAG: GAF domain-containing protein, partial [Thermoleophilia bacterium]